MNEKELYQIARILRGHGIKGEMKFAAIYPHLDRIKDEAVLYLKDRFGKILEVQIEKIRFTHAEGIVKFREIADKNEADRFNGGFLLIDKSDLPKLPKDEFYIDDLIGLDVLDQDGVKVGILNNVYSEAAYDMYEILHQGKKSLVPAVEEFITAIDIKKRTITLRVIEGLLE